MESWAPDLRKANMEMIELLEEYKTLISRLAERCEEGGMDQAVEKLKVFKKRLKLSKKKIPKTVKMVGEKKDSGKVWDKLNTYFETASPHILQQLQQSPGLSFNFLNLHAINRLSAIAKMIQYCSTSNMELKRFKEGRTPQRIKAWHKMSKITAITYGSPAEIYKESYVDHTGVCYPLLREMDYLLSLNSEAVVDEIAILKGLLKTEGACVRLETEVELERVSASNKLLLNTLMERVREAKEVACGDAKVQSRYREIIPAMKRKHENLVKKERRLLRFMELKTVGDSCANDKASTRKSPSGSLETMQEDLT
eukprot:TRINITY_DN8304_c0_g1_i5.p1 TRINITY_DN8304_c0_g1~~TRINITY_DN8304_c0_g1_i5.p1  ORF type:complete len:311 (-),score=59.87 TRINITY_DN8304_c0_g1_i5:18-950(-)